MKNEMTQTHFIEKQKLDFEFTSEQKAKDWSANTAKFYREEILPVLEKLFNKYFTADQWYTIGKLEIDLGKIDSRELKEVLFKKIETELLGLLKNTAVSRKSPINVGGTASALRELKEQFEVKSYDQKILEIFYTFLEHGILLWNGKIRTTAALEQEIKQHIPFHRLAALPAFIELARLHHVRMRLFHQFTAPFRKRVFHVLFFEELKFVRIFRRFILRKLELSPLDKPSKEQINKFIPVDASKWIISVPSSRQHEWPEAIVLSVLEKVTEGKKQDDQIFEFIRSLNYVEESESGFGGAKDTIEQIKLYSSHFIATRSIMKSPGKPAQPLNKAIDAESGPILQDAKFFKKPQGNDAASPDTPPIKPDKKKEGPTTYNDGATSSKQSSESSGMKSVMPMTQKRDIANPEELLQPEFQAPVTEFETTTPIQAGGIITPPEPLNQYYVMHAGLVLCWPYLNQLFERTGYLRDRKFKDQNRQQRAVHLLGYLAGSEAREEHELVLAKLLTNWPLSMPVIKRMKLTSKEKKEANDLLTNMIVNWPILKNTSVETLRSSFLQREGKLSKVEQGWKLIVEQKSYDMLLDHLPYSIAIIKLPWMEEILKVDWA